MSSMASIAQVVRWLPQATLEGDADMRVNRVHTDTRTIEAGDLLLPSRAIAMTPTTSCRKRSSAVRQQ